MNKRPLCKAVYSGSEVQVKAVLADKDIDIAATQNCWIGGPLKMAVQIKNVAIVKVLLEDPRIDVNAGMPLTYAAKTGNSAMVKLLCAHELTDLNRKSYLGVGSPWEAGFNGYAKIVRYLLADPRINPAHAYRLLFPGDCPLLSAAKNGRAEVVQLLLADPGIGPIHRLRWSFKESPLLSAATNGHVEVVKILLEDGRVDVNTGSILPLWEAVTAGHVEVIKHLLEDERIDGNEPDGEGQTALHWAAQNGHQSMYNTVLKHQWNWLKQLPLEMQILFSFVCRMLQMLDFHARRLQAKFLTSLSTSPDDLSDFPNRRRPPCTTMPWNIWPALVVLWGVCWMFYSPIACSFLDELDLTLFSELPGLPLEPLFYGTISFSTSRFRTRG